MKQVEIYTDGACRRNPGPGGWGALLRSNGHEKELCGGALETTNNQMEMMAAIKALESLKETCQVDLFTDSKYVKLGITEWIIRWKTNGFKNAKKNQLSMQNFGSDSMEWHLNIRLIGNGLKAMLDMLIMKEQMLWPTEGLS